MLAVAVVSVLVLLGAAGEPGQIVTGIVDLVRFCRWGAGHDRQGGAQQVPRSLGLQGGPARGTRIGKWRGESQFTTSSAGKWLV